MEGTARAKRVRIYLIEDERASGRPAYQAIVDLLRRERAQGATLLRAAEGFGASGELHVPHLVDVAPHLPVVVEWIDTPEQVERLLPAVRALVVHGLVTIDDTEMLRVRPPAARTR
jgi:PII-like signaling protein